MIDTNLKISFIPVKFFFFFSVKLRARLSSYVSDDVDVSILKVNYSSRLGVNVIKLAFSPLSVVCV